MTLTPKKVQIFFLIDQYCCAIKKIAQSIKCLVVMYFTYYSNHFNQNEKSNSQDHMNAIVEAIVKWKPFLHCDK